MDEKVFERLKVMHKNLAGSGIILIDGIISEEIGYEIEQVIDKVAESKKHADIYINSPGGSADAFLSIIAKMDAMSKNGMTFTTMCLDMAGCGAMLLLAAGTKRVCLKKSRITMFQPLWIKDSEKTSSDEGMMEAGMAILKTKNKIEELFGKLTSKGSKSLKGELFEARTITSGEALEAGIVDYIAG